MLKPKFCSSQNDEMSSNHNSGNNRKKRKKRRPNQNPGMKGNLKMNNSDHFGGNEISQS